MTARVHLLSFIVAAAASAAAAQELSPPPPRQLGGFFVPTLSLTETVDDNLFFTPFPERDLVSRLGLGLETGYRSTRFTFVGTGGIDGERFQSHRDFDTPAARRIGQLAFTYLPSRSVTLSAFSSYIKTQTPGELNVLSGLALGRSLARRVSVTPVAEYRIGGLTTLMGYWSLSEDTLDGRFAGTRTASLGLDRRVAPRDTLSLRYERRWFHFSGGERFWGTPGDSSTADVVTLGWMRDVGERTLLLLRGGPRSGKGEVRPELLASLKRRIKHGALAFTYSRSQATTLGKLGAVDVQSLASSITIRPAKELELTAGPAVFHNTLRGLKLTAWRLSVETLWHFSHFCYLGASYAFDLQQPDFGYPSYLRRNGLRIRLLVTPPQRRLEPEPKEPPLQEQPI